MLRLSKRAVLNLRTLKSSSTGTQAVPPNSLSPSVEDSPLPLLIRDGIIVASMEFQSLQDAIDLLEHAPPPSPPLHANSGDQLPGAVEPKLGIAWDSFHAGSS